VANSRRARVETKQRVALLGVADGDGDVRDGVVGSLRRWSRRRLMCRYFVIA